MKEDFAPLADATDNAASDATKKSDVLDELPLPYMEMDRHGFVTRANRATRLLYPEDHGDLIGKMPWDFMPTDQKEQSCAAYMLLMETGEEPPVVERSVFDRSGHFRVYQLHRRLMRDEEGHPVGMRMLSVDVSEERKALDEARRAQKWLEDVMASLADAVVVTDSLGFIRTVNPAAETLLGWKAAELKGKLIEKTLPVLSYVSGDKTKLSFSMTLEGCHRGIATLLDHERKEVRVEIGTSPILDKESGFTEGVVTVLRRLEAAG